MSVSFFCLYISDMNLYSELNHTFHLAPRVCRMYKGLRPKFLFDKYNYSTPIL